MKKISEKDRNKLVGTALVLNAVLDKIEALGEDTGQSPHMENEELDSVEQALERALKNVRTAKQNQRR